ncbi:asparagine synthase (glutamine-hydrolyzing) [Kitasatospora mediocidica]|uniref:asparagine synthase (glutamine-hydrolyzing) n=1 Tax=Kitasatospora mediocidica TaxID=58352 RepID=UPI0007C67F20|nr:asparagine synthase (glutamine-hydrolyzing) [Kitasatospora mediocidica]
MCAIAGEAALGGGLPGGSFAREACSLMRHRGPDESGFHDAAEVALGMCRLAVVGLDNGSQPTYTEDRSVVCVFNGEIYNHRELRARLERRGRRIGGTSDAHVIPVLYDEFGPDFVLELQGMFAIALYDTRSGRLLLATDRAGKKPIFYSRRADGSVAFASELPALLTAPGIDRRTDPVAIDQYLGFRVVPAPRTAFRAVRKVPPATVLTFAPGELESAWRYWAFDFTRTDHEVDFEEAVDRVDALLQQAVTDRLESEVPLGAMLSGGLDSSLVVALTAQRLKQPLHTFSVGFEHAAFDESQHARTVAAHFGTRHHSFLIRPQDAPAAADTILRHTGEPYAFPSAIASYYMYRLAREQVTVVLTGDGSDEIFAGYKRYKPFDGPDGAPQGLAGRYQKVLADGVGDSLKSLLYSPEFIDRLPGSFPPDHLSGRLAETAGHPQAVDRLMQLDCNFWLPDAQLVKIDRMSMANSVEARSPFLDHQLIAYATGLPVGTKLRDGDEKAVLKAVARRYLPAGIVDRRKQELAVPLESWLGAALRERIQSTLLAEPSLERGYFRPDRLRAFVSEFRPEHSYALWTLYMLERWHQLFVDGPALPDACATPATPVGAGAQR